MMRAIEPDTEYWLGDYEIFPGKTVLSDSDPGASLEVALANTRV